MRIKQKMTDSYNFYIDVKFRIGVLIISMSCQLEFHFAIYARCQERVVTCMMQKLCFE